jgi:NADPH-dependent 2,4-dienoyl-CoA reductase/sulfur reductase-like enzyme
MTPPKMAPIGALVIGCESARYAAVSGVDVGVLDGSSGDAARRTGVIERVGRSSLR